MISSSFIVLVVGSGNFGSRWLQGLSKTDVPLSIHVVDPSVGSLINARTRWDDVNSVDSLHTIKFHPTLEKIPKNIDLVIVVTTADVRPGVVASVAKIARVRYWILEKVLAQSLSGIDKIEKAIDCQSLAWVNTSRRRWKWYNDIRCRTETHSPCLGKIWGGVWELGSNVIHYLDLFSWWTGETLVDVITQNLDNKWCKSKTRTQFYTIYGELIANFSGGSSLVFCWDTRTSVMVELNGPNGQWTIDETEGIAVSSYGLTIPGKLEHQSENSAPLIKSILETGQCDLPSLNQSASMHRILISALLDHWNHNMSNKKDFLPIS